MKEPPKSTRRQRRRTQTESHLAATAFRLFETHGYDSVAMEQIAAEADVAKATLYKYFPVKEALIAHHFRVDIAAGMAERGAALMAYDSFDARMRYLLAESAEWHSARKAYLTHYIRYLTNHALHDGQATRDKSVETISRQILTLMFQAAQDAGEVGTRQTAAQIAWSFEYLLFGATAAWLIDPSTDLTQRFLAAFDLCMHGVAISPNPLSPQEPSNGL